MSAHRPAHPTPAAPRWVTALDILTLILTGVLLRSFLGGGYQIRFAPGWRISLDSWERIALWLLVVLVLRHALWRATPFQVRARGWLQAVRRSETVGAVLPVFLLSRLLVALIGYIAVITIGFETEPGWRGHTNPFLDLYARWDAGWYLEIARDGYPDHFNPARQNPVAFFPGLPLLMRGVAILLDVDPWLAAICVVTLAFLGGLMYVYRLARETLDADQAHAAILLLAFYPFAVSYSAVLTESLFLLAAAGAFFHFSRGQLLKAAAFALAVGVIRPNGFLLCVPLALLALTPFAQRHGWLPGSGAAARPPRPLLLDLAVASLPFVGVLLYSLYLGSLTGDPLAWMKAQQAWGRETAGGLTMVGERWELIASAGWQAYVKGFPVELLEAAAAFFALGAVWPITRRFGLAFGLFVALAVVPPLFTMGPVSLGRYTAPLFPIFLWLGASVAAGGRAYWLAAFAMGQALVGVLFFTWRPPY